MDMPIFREWADLATQTFPDDARSSSWRQREKARSLFYAGASAVLAGIVKALDGDRESLMRYLEACRDDLARYAEEKAEAGGVKS